MILYGFFRISFLAAKTNFVYFSLKSHRKKMDNAFTRVKSIITRLRNVLKCQKCLELKPEDSMLFYHMCDHFYCVACAKDSKSCLLCNNSLDRQKMVVDDKNILSLYQCLAKFQLPAKDDVEKIYKAHLESKEEDLQNDEVDVVAETPKNHSKRKIGSMKDRSLEKDLRKKNTTPPEKENEENVVTKGRRSSVIKNVTPVSRKGGRGRNPTPITTPAGTSTISILSSSESSKLNSSSSKVNINKRNPKGETQLHIACKKLNFNAMKELIAAGANPNAQDNAGWTPLHDSVFSGKIEVIKFLLDNGAKVNAPGLENTTALHEAIAKGNVPMVKLLLEYGADVNAMNIFRETPLDLVTKYKLAEMKEILLEASTNIKPNTTNEIEEPEDNIIVYKHNLGVEDEKLVNKFVDKFNIEVVSSIACRTPPTHIIVSKEKFEVTWGLIALVPMGCWIVTVDWVKDSLTGDILKPAGQYPPSKPTADGFAKARANKTNQSPGLFTGCHFYFGGNFDQYSMKNVTVGKEELKKLVEKQGGVILKRAPDPESLALEKTIPYHAPDSSSLRETSYFIIYQSEKWDPKPKYNMSHMKTLPVNWLLCCVFNFELIDPKNFDSCQFLQ